MPTEMFELLFDNSLATMIADETNWYAAQKANVGFSTDSNEIKVFVAILLLSGYIPLPRKRMFWEDSTEARNEAVASAMRVNDLLHYLHSADNDNLKESKLAKVLPS